MNHRRTIAVVTGSRAEFGLLRTVIQAITSHPSLQHRLIITGTHLLPDHNTVDEISKECSVFARIPMYTGSEQSRFDDAAALGRGISGFAESLRNAPPDVVLVLGDRIEAFAAAAAASISGIRVAHMHGGDRAEGIADEAMRHAITKLAHIHFPATQTSAMRIIAMGEDPRCVHIVGSPAIDELNTIPPLNEAKYRALGSPVIIVLLHPVGDDDAVELERAAQLIRAAMDVGPTLVLHPNHDPGRSGIMRTIELSNCRHVAHLPRSQFVGLLRRAKVIVGNSSAGLIECAAIPIRAINIGRRQAGREMPANVINLLVWDYQTIRRTLSDCISKPPLSRDAVPHPYGNGLAGHRTAESLATFNEQDHPVAKRNTY